MPVLLFSLTLLAASLCKYTIRDVGFVFIGDPLVTIEDGGIVHRAGDGGQKLFPSAVALDGGPTRRALAQDLLEAVAVILILPGSSMDRVQASAELAVADLQQMSDQGRLARALDGPLRLQVLNTRADPVGGFALGWSTGGSAGAVVLYGRGRLAGPVLMGPQATRDAILEQLEVVSDSCECDRPRTWLTARHLPLPWDQALRVRARDQLGFDPHSPRIRDDMDRILARGPRPDGAAPLGDVVVNDPLFGYDEVVLRYPIPVAEELPNDPPRRFGNGLFWLCIGLLAAAVLGIGVHFSSSEAA